jgi:small nuclear ribonucleoprotein (snRNP)-like protein
MCNIAICQNFAAKSTPASAAQFSRSTDGSYSLQPSLVAVDYCIACFGTIHVRVRRSCIQLSALRSAGLRSALTRLVPPLAPLTRAASAMDFLKTLTDKEVIIITLDGRTLVGRMRGVDDKANIVLSDAHERLFSRERGVEREPLGL